MLLCLGVSPRALAARRGRALLGGGSSSPFPPSAAACVMPARPFGGGLSTVYLLFGSCAERTRWGFPSLSSSLIRPTLWSVTPWMSSHAVGPVLAGPFSVASDASKLYLRRASAPCSGGCPALPTHDTISIASFAVAILSHCAAPSPPSGPCPLIARWVGGFSSPPPYVLPLSVLGRCKGSWGFVSPGSLCLFRC